LLWLNVGVRTEHLSELAKALEVGLRAPGLCLACLLFVASEVESGNARGIAAAITLIAPNLWEEGFHAPVALALEQAARDGVPDADRALREFEQRGVRSAIFRAVVRRLAGELAEEVERDVRAMLN
jgi:hypothetical protein